jgi:cytochrome c oxidase cbb3-type subunit III
MRNKSKHISGLVASLLLFSTASFAGSPPAPSIFSNPLAITLIALMIILVIVIGILANIVIGAAEIKMKKRKTENAAGKVVMVLLTFFIGSSALLAQGTGATTETTATATKGIGGMDASTFYLMVTVLFLELLTIITLLLNIKLLLKKEKISTGIEPVLTPEEKANKLSWWDRVNKLRPVSQEAELDLGHEYDGIRELNNRLPPWWLYGFYATIVFAIVYLWRFEVSHTGPSSKQEYETSVAKAEIRVQEYLKKKGDAVDENTVTLLTGADDIAAGKAIFMDPSKCPACHGADGGGNAVGPNLTDEYWLYGGSVKNIFKTIKYGTSKGMRSWKDDLSAKQIAQLTAYIKTLKGTKPAAPKEPQGELYKEEAAPVADSAAADAKKVVMN